MNKYLKIIFASLILNLIFIAFSFAQDRVLVVNDEKGNPLTNAIVIIGEAGNPIFTNEKGEFNVPTKGSSILVQAEGFESYLFYYNPQGDVKEIVLRKMPFQMSEKDNIDVPFGKYKKRQISGAVSTLNSPEILNYDYQGSVGGILGGRVPGLFGSSNIRGIGNPLYVVDGVVRPSAPNMNIHEIENVSVLKDISTTMLYGSQAQNGVIYITTKRGQPLKKSMSFHVDKGMNRAIAFPNYLSAPDYMELYNEALENDGLGAKYESEQIANTRNGNDPIRYPDEHYYNSTYLNDWSGYHRLNAEITGGNNTGQFFLNMGWNHSNSLLRIGEGANEKNDQLNMRGNINYKITEMVKLTFDGSVMFDISNGPRYSNSSQDFWYLASTLRPDIYPTLIPLDLIEDKSLNKAARPIPGDYVFGGTSEYQTNIYGELMNNGTRGFTDRLISFTTGLDFDLKSIAKGLTSKVYFSFDMFNQYREEILNSYAVYDPIYEDDLITDWRKYKTDLKVGTKTLGDAYYNRRFGIYGTLEYNRIFDGDHEVNVTALAYRDNYNEENVLQNSKHLNFGARINYMLKNKYVVQLTGVQAGSVKLFEAKPWSFSPGIGLGWIMTEENIFQNNSWVDYLKLRANWAILQTDENVNYNLDRDYYTSGSGFAWSHGTYNNSARNIYYGNRNLKWEKINNINMGLESALFNYRLGLEASYFYNRYSDVITQRTNSLPSFFGNLPYDNFESYQTQGVEVGLNYTFNVGDLKTKLGGNFTYSVPKVLAKDELNYPDSYRRHVGKETDALFGLVALGLFRSQEDIDNHVAQDFGPVQPGDIKYLDLNQDGIVDDNDVTIIGNSRSRVSYGINLLLQFKSFEFFILGSGQSGQDRFFNNSYYWVYGDRKYSEVVFDRWTPETAETATYPRLSSSSNANNYRNSSFWIKNTNFFNLNTAQITYKLTPTNIDWVSEIRIFLRGSNLAMISKEKEKLQLNIGRQPQMRSFSVGVNILL